MEKIRDKKHIVILIGLVILALLSFTMMSTSGIVASISQNAIDSLDQKRNMVLSLAATSTAASAAITAVPGDFAIPVAENLADISDYLIIIVAAIWLQKYLLAISGILTFKIFVPIACLLGVFYVIFKKESFYQLALKVVMFAALIFFLVPTSVQVSDHIEKTNAQTIQRTIDKTEKANKVIDQKSSKKSGNILKDTFAEVKGEKDKTVNTIKSSLSTMIDAVSVMIVTSCLIPVAVLLFFIWVINLIFGLSISTDIRKFSLVGKSIRKKKDATYKRSH